MVGLFKTLLIIGLVWYAIKFLTRLFAPQIQKYAAKKMQEKFNGQFQGGFNQQQNQENQQEGKTNEPVGKTTVVNNPGDNSKINTNKTGDYIDFEEVDEK